MNVTMRLVMNLDDVLYNLSRLSLLRMDIYMVFTHAMCHVCADT